MSADGPSNSGAYLPCRLTVINASDPAQNMAMTVIKPIFSLNVTLLPPQLFTSRKSVYISPASRALMGLFHHVFLVKVQDLHLENLRHGLLIACGIYEGAYELLYGCLDPLNIEGFDSDENIIPEPLGPGAGMAEYIESWKTNVSEGNTITCSRSLFSMKPPLVPALVQLSPVAASRYTISPQNEKNPLDFIRSRYFNTLYSLTTPLSYFPKTALSRFKNMCTNDAVQMKECLEKVYLSPENLDQRRLAKYGLSIELTGPPALKLSHFEAENQAMLVSKHHPETTKPELLETLVLELKIREAQLQILLLLEILICSQIDEKSFLDSNAKSQEKTMAKKKKPALIRRKKNKVIPTFLGIGVPEANEQLASTETRPENDHLSPFGLFSSLTTLVDQIGLWDSLLDRGKMDKDQNTHGFLAFVIVPYFSKSLPLVVQYIIKLFKGLRPHILKPKLPKAERKKSKSLFPTPGSESHTPEHFPETDGVPHILEFTRSLSALDLLNSQEHPNKERKLKFSKTLLKSENIPFLNRASTTVDLNDLQPAFSLKRSKSNLGTKNLKRRQVDMSITRNEPTEADLKKQSLFLFADARKTKINASFTQQNPAPTSVCQVEATPAKPKPNTTSIDAPQVFATPSNQRTVDMGFIIKETPQAAQEKKTSIHDRLSQIARTSTNALSIISSPVRDDEDAHIFLHGRVDAGSSPVKAVSSSPVKLKTKPGQQISLKQSPFYNNLLSGSPVLSRPIETIENQLLPLSKRMGTTVKTMKSTITTVKSTAKKVVRKPAPKKVTKPNPLPPSLSNLDIFEIGQSDPEPVNSTPFIVPHKTTLELEKNTPVNNLPEPALQTQNNADSNSDSDLDYERLLASVQKPATKKYNKKRAF